MQRKILMIAGLVVLVGGWAAFRPERLFVNQTVNEGLEGAKPSTADVTMASVTSPMALAAGRFHKGAHETSGAATVFRLADGKRVLRLTGFATSNGPDVHVYLVNAADATDNDAVKKAGFVDLGSLKGNVGDQNYDVPADLDLVSHRAVTIWCARFGVNFGTAPLIPQS